MLAPGASNPVAQPARSVDASGPMADDQDREHPEDEAEEASDAEESERDDASTDDEDEASESQSDDAADENEDEDEDEEPVRAKPEPPPKKKKKASSKKGGSARRSEGARRRPRGPAVLPPEKEIRAPSRQTLLLLGVMAFSTLAMWGSARFACNAHPAQTRKPREVTTLELSRDPKDAALEMQQRWNSYDFTGALELASGSIAEELKKAAADCEKDAKACEQKKQSVEGRVLATAALLDKEGSSAKVRVVSRGGALGEQTVVYSVEQVGPSWKVSGRTTAPTPAPAPAPTGSAAPAPSGSAG
jgi:hypothetical protein